MINAQTLEQARKACESMGDARRHMESLMDNELQETGWMPGFGEKPHRVRVLQDNITELITMSKELDGLWN